MGDSCFFIFAIAASSGKVDSSNICSLTGGYVCTKKKIIVFTLVGGR